MFALCALLLRRQIVPHVIALGLFGIALGFAIVTLKTALIGHPVLRFPASGVRSPALSNCARRASTPTGFVLRVDRIDGGRIEELPSASGFRSSAAQRLQSALSLKSKPRSSRRCSRSKPAENEQMIRRNINKLAITGPK